MIPALLAHHHQLIRDAQSFGTPPSPPVLTCYPRPPTTPVVFSVSGLSQLDLTISTAISPAKSLATITTAQLTANVAIVQQGTVAGCTIALTGSPVVSGVQITGTPTEAGDHEVTLTFVNATNCETLGGMVVTITVLDPAVAFVGGSNANYSGRAGIPVDALLASPSIDYNWAVTAHPSGNILGCQFVFAWTPGDPTSSGTLRLQGTPILGTTDGIEQLVNTTVTVTYRHGSRVLGTTQHAISISPRWEAPAPAPAPAPSPPAPAPTPAPTAAPLPLPAPVPIPDPHWASVLALFNFQNAAVQNLGEGSVLAHAAPVGGTLTTTDGYIDTGISGYGASGAWSGTVFWGAADRAAVAVDAACIVSADMGLWSLPHGTLVPLASLAVDAADLCWAIGLLRQDVAAGGGLVHAHVYPVFIQGRAAGYDAPVVALGPMLPQSYAGALIVSGQWSVSGSTCTQACWLNGDKGQSVTATKARGGVDGLIATVGGTCPLPGYQAVPIIGVVDEVRVTAALRRSLAGDIDPIDITLPWATY